MHTTCANAHVSAIYHDNFRLCRAKMNAQIVALAVVMIVATCAAVMPAMAAEDSLI